MKFAYIDESGDQGQGDVFVMAGLLIDAYRLRKYTAEFDTALTTFLSNHPSAPKEMKTKAFINGRGGWNKVSPDDRKQFLSEMCNIALECSKIVGLAISFKAFTESTEKDDYHLPCAGNYWALCGMFVAALIQKKVQNEKNNKGLTVLIFDDNRAHMPKVSDGLYMANSWFDALCQQRGKIRGKSQWLPVKPIGRFDHIINTAFAIKSEHSSLIQIADSVSYVYRRWLELGTEKEAYAGEKAYYDQLAAKLDKKRIRIGLTPKAECVDFYQAIKHPQWNL